MKPSKESNCAESKSKKTPARKLRHLLVTLPKWMGLKGVVRVYLRPGDLERVTEAAVLWFLARRHGGLEILRGEKELAGVMARIAERKGP